MPKMLRDLFSMDKSRQLTATQQLRCVAPLPVLFLPLVSLTHSGEVPLTETCLGQNGHGVNTQRLAYLTRASKSSHPIPREYACIMGGDGNMVRCLSLFSHTRHPLQSCCQQEATLTRQGPSAEHGHHCGRRPPPCRVPLC